VTVDGAGNFYGTTLNGGEGFGTVYEIDATGHESVLHAFAGGTADGASPSSGVIRDPSGDLYGVTSKGGTANAGAVYKIDTSGQKTVIYSFAGGKSDGSGPNCLIRDDAGVLFGTTAAGGTNNQGIVFKIDAAGQESIIYHFSGGGDGGTPLGVVLDSAGNLYGATAVGGAAYYGAVFKIDAGVEQVLYSFKDAADGGNPAGGVVLDSAGNLYGATAHGGAYGSGVLFKVDPVGQESVVYNFAGGSPAAGVVLDTSGNLYGTTPLPGNGVVYKVNLSGQETLLTGFPTATNGSNPQGELAMDGAGNLYGTAFYGGPEGDGIVYKLSPAGHETTLYAFSGGTGGAYPQGVTLDTEGNLYGVAQGGTPGQGLVYKLSPVGQETVLYTFTGETDGGIANPGLFLDSEGNIYGTTRVGGYGHGAIYKLDAAGQETVLYNFEGGVLGDSPQSLIRDETGNLYGTTSSGGGANYGTLFKLDSAGQFSILCSFNGTTGGGMPAPGIVLDLAGNIYGATSYGGTNKKGLLYKVNQAGQETILYNFCNQPNCADGAVPCGGVVLDPSGNLYRVASDQFNRNHNQEHGAVYMLNAAGQESVLYSFCSQPNCADGEIPNEIFRNPAGHLFGTTYSGGTNSGGVAFEITVP
jgi:uncharacterized repeat protein (TIGR03803 family)